MDEKPKRRKRRGVLRAAAVLLVLTGPVVIGMMWGVRERFELARLVAAAREAGQPVTPEELAACYTEGPSSDNGALILEQAFAKVDKGEFKPLPGLPTRSESFDPATLAACERHLDENRAYMDLLYAAVEKPYCQFRTTYTSDVVKTWMLQVSMPPLPEIQRAAQRLSMEAFVAAERVEPVRAVRAVLAGLALGNSLREDSTRIPQIERTAVNQTTVDGLERVLSRIALSDQELEQLGKALTASEDPSAQAKAMLGMRCFGIDQFGEVTSGPCFPLMSSRMNLELFLYRLLGAEARDRLSWFITMTAAVDASSLPYEERLDALKRIEEDVAALPGNRVLTKESFRTFCGGSQGVFLRDVATLRTAAAGVAVERHRLLHGELPTDLEALAPEEVGVLPEDPYIAKPLRYKRLTRGYVVYSVGSNLADDGGSQEIRNSDLLDVPFVVER